MIDELIEIFERLHRLIVVLTGLILLWLTAWYLIQTKAAALGNTAHQSPSATERVAK